MGISWTVLRKNVPLEAIPLGFAIVGVAALGSYRMYRLTKSPEAILKKDDIERWDRDFSARQQEREKNKSE